jgi:hypothetical protein
MQDGMDGLRNRVLAELGGRATDRELLARFMSDFQWHSNAEMYAVAGNRAMGRKWDLEQEGWVFTKPLRSREHRGIRYYCLLAKAGDLPMAGPPPAPEGAA